MSALLVVLFLGSAGMFCIEASVLAHGVSIWWLPFFALSAATVIGIWFWQTWGLYGYFGSSLLGMMLFARFGDVVDAVRWLSVLAIAAVIIAPKWRYFRSGAPVVDDAQLNPLPARPGIVW